MTNTQDQLIGTPANDASELNDLREWKAKMDHEIKRWQRIASAFDQFEDKLTEILFNSNEEANALRKQIEAMHRRNPNQGTPQVQTQGFGIIVTATGEWLMASDSEQGAIVWRTFDEATAYLVSQQSIHGVVTPFCWR